MYNVHMYCDDDEDLYISSAKFLGRSHGQHDFYPFGVEEAMCVMQCFLKKDAMFREWQVFHKI